jgi:hypothetical protein
MVPERCDECGFDGGQWSDADALAAVALLPARWRDNVDALDVASAQRRPIASMWSIAEYTDHIREVAFGMRFVLDVALADPGADLGASPAPRFDVEPRAIDVERSLMGFAREIGQLCDRLRQLSAEQWECHSIVNGDRADPHWIVRHALHDVTHHIGDIQRLRAALEQP